MVKIRKYANGIERFLHGEKGQRFFNFAYQLGPPSSSGAPFSRSSISRGNTLLCIGMGTEVAMFILTAFDRPPKEYSWEEVFPVLDSKNPDDRPNFAEGSVIVGTVGTAGQVGQIEFAGFPGLVGQLPGMPTSRRIMSRKCNRSPSRWTASKRPLAPSTRQANVF